MGDPKTVGEVIAEITAQLEPIESDLQRALDTANQYVISDLAYQWDFEFEWGYVRQNGHLEGQRFHRSIAVFQLPSQLGKPYDWQPRPGESIPYVQNAWSVVSAVRRDYPPALEAKNQLVRDLPTIGSSTTKTVTNVYDLIKLPESLQKFYDRWTEVENSILPLEAGIGNLLAIDANLEWSGRGYRAYEPILRSQARGAAATTFAVQTLRKGGMDLIEMTLDLVDLLAEVAKKNIGDVENLVDTLISLTDPKSWGSIISNITGLVGKNLADQIDMATDGARVLVAAAKALDPFATLEGELNERLEQVKNDTDSPYPSWPKPEGDMTEPWEGDVLD